MAPEKGGGTALKPDGALDTAKIFAAHTPDNMAGIFEMLFSAGGILSTPALCADGLIFGTADGRVYRVRWGAPAASRGLGYILRRATLTASTTRPIISRMPRSAAPGASSVSPT